MPGLVQQELMGPAWLVLPLERQELAVRRMMVLLVGKDLEQRVLRKAMVPVREHCRVPEPLDCRGQSQWQHHALVDG